jgi:hypothetical protein
MTDRPDDRTQPISTGSTSEQPAVDAGQAAVDAADVPAWANATPASGEPASVRPVPVAVMTPAAAYGPSVPPIAAAPATGSWRSRMSGGRGLAVAALLVGLGLGAVGGAAVTFAATHHEGIGTTADGTPGFDRDGDGGFGPHGGRGGPPPGGQLPDGQLPGGQLPGGDSPQNDDNPGQLPGGGTGSGANGTSQAT